MPWTTFAVSKMLRLKDKLEPKQFVTAFRRLYRRLWLSLQERPDLLEDEEWLTEWQQVREESCWLGRKGEEWGFFSTQELVWKDDDHRSELFKNEIPFWGFNNDLLELAKELGVKSCYTDSDIEFKCNGDWEERILDKSAEVRDLRQNVRDFLNSPHLCGEYGEEKSVEVLDRLLVRRVEKLEVRFKLKGVSVLDPNPRQSFLEATEQEAMLWLASGASENQYPWLIGDALQYHFGNVKELSAFVEDLLTKSKESVLIRWQQKGLQTTIAVSSSEKDSKEGEEHLKGPVDDKLSNEFDRTKADTTVDESDVGIGNGDSNPTTKGSGTRAYNRSGTSGTSRSGGHSLRTSNNRGSSGGGHGSSGGGGRKR